jgi:hypothetical protein
VLCAGLAGTGWAGVRAAGVRDHLTAAADLIGRLREELEGGDARAARTTLTRLQREARAARRGTGGVEWRAASRLPVLGEETAAVRGIAAAVDDLAQQVFPPLFEVARSGDLSTVVTPGGQWDLGRLSDSAPYLVQARAATERIRDRAAGLRRADLARPVASAATELFDGLDELGTLTATAARTAVLLPGLLGADGPRTHLVLLQDPAELRATGGLPGAFAVVHAEKGSLRLLRQGTFAPELGVFPRPVRPLTSAQRDLYTDRPGLFPADINLGPHFPTAAALAREMYRLRTGVTVDSVIATDPVALSYLLPATGALPMPAGPALDAGNAVRMLLSEAHATAAKPGGGNAYVAAATKAMFEAFSRGLRTPYLALGGLTRAAGERRLLIWSAHPQEQEAIAGSVLEGAMPADDGDRPAVGVFLNDASGAKLDYYLDPAVHLEATGCQPDGRRRLQLRVTLRSTAPHTGLPAGVLGLKLAGDPYTARTQVLVFGPAGGGVGEARVNGVLTPIGSGEERGRSVGVLMVDLPPGASRVLEVDLLTPPLANPRDTVTPRLWLTPAVNPWHRTVTPGPGCPTRG